MTIILFGDSISSGTPTTIANYKQSTGYQMQQLTDRRVIDMSHAGMRVCRAIDDNNWVVKLADIALLDSINILSRLPMGKDVDVIIQLGANDVKNNTPVLDVKSYIKAAVTFIQRFGSNPVLISPVGTYLEAPGSLPLYDELRVAYGTIAAQHGCQHIGGRSLIDPNNPDLYALPDDEHLSALGHFIMASNIMAALCND